MHVLMDAPIMDALMDGMLMDALVGAMMDGWTDGCNDQLTVRSLECTAGSECQNYSELSVSG